MVGARGEYAPVTLRRYRAAYNAPRTQIMDALERVERMLMELSPPEKARLLQRLARDIGHAFPGIESTPGVARRRAAHHANAHPGVGARASTPPRRGRGGSLALVPDASSRRSGQRVAVHRLTSRRDRRADP